MRKSIVKIKYWKLQSCRNYTKLWPQHSWKISFGSKSLALGIMLARRVPIATLVSIIIFDPNISETSLSQLVFSIHLLHHVTRIAAMHCPFPIYIHTIHTQMRCLAIFTFLKNSTIGVLDLAEEDVAMYCDCVLIDLVVVERIRRCNAMFSRSVEDELVRKKKKQVVTRLDVVDSRHARRTDRIPALSVV